MSKSARTVTVTGTVTTHTPSSPPLQTTYSVVWSPSRSPLPPTVCHRRDICLVHVRRMQRTRRDQLRHRQARRDNKVLSHRIRRIYGYGLAHSRPRHLDLAALQSLRRSIEVPDSVLLAFNAEFSESRSWMMLPFRDATSLSMSVA